MEQQPANSADSSSKTDGRIARDRVLALAIGISLALGIALPVVLLFEHTSLVEALRIMRQSSRNFWVVDTEARIRAELKDAADLPGWAGSYYYADGSDTNARLHCAPNSGFSFTSSGGMGLDGQNYGAVRVHGSRIQIEPELENHPGGVGSVHTEFIFIPWGDRSYLITPDQMVTFALDIRIGREPRTTWYGDYFLSFDTDLSVPSEGPTVPAEFAGAFEAARIRAEVLEVTEIAPGLPDSGVPTIRLDIGKKSGAYRGLTLSPEGSSVDGSSLVVYDVEDHECTARVRGGRAGAQPLVGSAFIIDRVD